MSHESGCLIITDSSSSVSLLSWALPQARPPLVLTSPCEVDRAEAGQVRPARLERRRAEESSWIRVWVSVCQLPAWVSTLHPTGGLGTCSRAFYSPEPLPLNWFPFPFFMVKEELNDQFSYTKTSICNDSGDISGILGMRKRVKSILKNDLEHIARKVHLPRHPHTLPFMVWLLSIYSVETWDYWYASSWETKKDRAVCVSGCTNVHPVPQTLRNHALCARPHATT